MSLSLSVSPLNSDADADPIRLDFCRGLVRSDFRWDKLQYVKDELAAVNGFVSLHEDQLESVEGSFQMRNYVT